VAIIRILGCCLFSFLLKIKWLFFSIADSTLGVLEEIYSENIFCFREYFFFNSSFPFLMDTFSVQCKLFQALKPMLFFRSSLMILCYSRFFSIVKKLILMDRGKNCLTTSILLPAEKQTL